MANQLTLFIPCLVDQLYPDIGMAMVRILEHLGYSLDYPENQTCCGQPAFNAGQRDDAYPIASAFVNTMPADHPLICPSGSCTSMTRNYFGPLFKDKPDCENAALLGSRVFEFSEFIHSKQLHLKLKASTSARVAYHASCHSYRELNITRAPIDILNEIDGIDLHVPDGEPVCCGFGGLFSQKFQDISQAMTETRLQQLNDDAPEYIVTNDPGCLMQMKQKAEQMSLNTKVLHLTEFLDLCIDYSTETS